MIQASAKGIKMIKANKVVKAKIKAEEELQKVADYLKKNKDTAFYLSEDSTALCSGITVKHFEKIEDLASQLTEEHLKMVNLQITIKAMDAERTRLEAIIRNKPISISALLKASNLTQEEIAKKLGISF